MDGARPFSRSYTGCHLTHHGLPPYAPSPLIVPSNIKFTNHDCVDHWHDVLIGSLLGTTMAYFSYRQYYPSLDSEFSHRPYVTRIKREGHEILPIHHRRSPSSQQMLPPQAQAVGDDVHGEDSEDELLGTVPRPRPQQLEDVWGEDEH